MLMRPGFNVLLKIKRYANEMRPENLEESGGIWENLGESPPRMQMRAFVFPLNEPPENELLWAAL